MKIIKNEKVKKKIRKEHKAIVVFCNQLCYKVFFLESHKYKHHYNNLIYDDLVINKFKNCKL